MGNKSLLRKVINMWIKRRQLNISGVTSVVSSIFFILSIIGIFTMTGVGQIVSIGLLVTTFIVLFYEFFFELPAKVYQEAQSRIAELLPLEQALEFQRSNPVQFISARVDSLFVEKESPHIGCAVVIASRLPFEIPMKEAAVILWLPEGEGHCRCDMHTLTGESCGSISGEAKQHDRQIRVYCYNNPELSSMLLNFLGEHPCSYLPCVKGDMIINTDGGEIRLEIPEASVIVKNLLKLTPDIGELKI